MSRIPLDHKPTPLVRIAEIYSKRRYGAVLQPGQALLHNRKVLLSMIGYENKVARWNALDPTVKAVAVLAAAAEIGCGWCLDFGFWASFHRGVDPVSCARSPTGSGRPSITNRSGQPSGTPSL